MGSVVRWVAPVVAVLVGCASVGPGASLVTERPPGRGAEVEALDAAAETAGGDGVLVLASATVDALTVRWVEGFAPDASGFRLRWRSRPAPEGEELTWRRMDLDASVREHTLGRLAAATPYQLRLNALDAEGEQGAEAAVATFATLGPPPRNLSATVVAHDAARLSWDGPGSWAPMGYTLQWRLRGSGEFLGRLELPPGRRAQTVTGLAGGQEYVFRLTARSATGHHSDPATLRLTTPTPPAGDLKLEISAPSHCTTLEGSSAGYGWGGPEEDRYWVREGVATVPVQWRVSGGQAPYSVRVADTETTGTTGTTEVTCALAGIDLDRLKDPDINVVESGPKTITISAGDAAGNTTTRTHTIEIIEHVGTAGNFYADDTLTPGHTYYLFGRYFEAPEGERIAFAGLMHVEKFNDSEMWDLFRHVVDGDRHTSAAMNTMTGERTGTWVTKQVHPGSWQFDFSGRLTVADLDVWDKFFATMRFTPFPAGDPRNEPPTPLAAAAATTTSTGRGAGDSGVAQPSEPLPTSPDTDPTPTPTFFTTCTTWPNQTCTQPTDEN